VRDYREERSNTETHNDLSGEAQTAAQVRTVYGGLHMYTPTPTDQARAGRTRRRLFWQINGCIALIVVTGITAVMISAKRSAEDSRPNGWPPPANDSPMASKEAPGKPRESQEKAEPVFSADVPPLLDAASEQYYTYMPRLVQMMTIQVYRCGNSVYNRMAIVSVELPKLGPPMDILAHEYAKKLASVKWPSMFPHHRSIIETGRSSMAGHRYYGLQLELKVKTATVDPCGAKSGVVKALILDCDDSYVLFVVAADLDGNPQLAVIPTEQDVDFLMASARPLR
jgi:hypothetical protein